MTYHSDDDGIERAEKAIERARVSSTQTDRLIAEAQEAIAETKRWREDNHFTIKLRQIITNGAAQ